MREIKLGRHGWRRWLFLLASPLFLTAVLVLDTSGWGWNTHRFMNGSSVYHLPNSMQLFIADSTFFADHSTDADQRRNPGDTSLYAEGPRHYLDIDDYPDYQTLPRDLDTLIALYGWERVKNNGTNPWATVWVHDSLVAQLSRGDWERAKLSAADLGHYIADAHQPLHCTRNYNGQFTNNYGIHSRYETQMLSPSYYLSALFVVPDSAIYIADRLEYAFSSIIHSVSLVDSILHADDYAKSVSGWNGSNAAPASYYDALWQKTGDMTIDQVQRGSRAIAHLWFTAWTDAGLLNPTAVPPSGPTRAAEFHLSQNFPNPFNAQTTISYTLPVGGTVTLSLFTADGQRVRTLVRENQSAGLHTTHLDASELASGVYFYQLRLGSFAQTRKLILLR